MCQLDGLSGLSQLLMLDVSYNQLAQLDVGALPPSLRFMKVRHRIKEAHGDWARWARKLHRIAAGPAKSSGRGATHERNYGAALPGVTHGQVAAHHIPVPVAFRGLGGVGDDAGCPTGRPLLERIVAGHVPGAAPGRGATRPPLAAPSRRGPMPATWT